MSNPLRNASAEVRARVRELGGDDLVAALTRLVEDEEEFAVLWFDAHEEGYSAEEILDWAVIDVVALGAAVYVELNIEFAAYADVGEEG